MDNLKDAYAFADVLFEEHQEMLWDMIKDVQNKKDGSLLKLANQLMEEGSWSEKDIHDLMR